MSAYRFVTLTCDGCGQVWDEMITNSIREARAVAAARRRWTRRGTSGDLCGRCSTGEDRS